MVAFTLENYTVTVSSVVDGTNTYALDKQTLGDAAASETSARIYSAANTSTSALTITVTLSGPVYGVLQVYELKDGGGSAAVELDATGGTKAATGSLTINANVTTTAANCAVIVAVNEYSNSTYAVDSGYSNGHTRTAVNNSYHAQEYNLDVGAAGSKALAMGSSSNVNYYAAATAAYKLAGGGGSSVGADQGTFSLTGQSVNLLFGRTLSASQGTFTHTGQAVTLTKTNAYSITANYGTFSLSGQDVTFQKTAAGSYVLTAEVGTFSLVGQGALASYSMNVEGGTFSLAGQDVTFARGYPASYSLTVDVGTYSLVGRSARLDWSGAPIVPGKNTGIQVGMRMGL